MQTIRTAFENNRVNLSVRSRELPEILGVAVDIAIATGQLGQAHRETVIAALLAHSEDSAAIGHAVAVPHCYVDEAFEAPISVFLRLEHPLNLDAPDGVPTRFFFVLMGPPGDADGHLDELMHIARLTTDPEFRYDLTEAETATDLLIALDAHTDRKSDPVHHTAQEGLAFTGRFAGGLMDDVRRKASTFKKEFRDGIHPKTVGATLFLFFACLAPAVTFGGLMGQFTGGQIGAVEMLVSTAIGGIIYALVAGQPLIILGGIGPLLIFTGILYQLCADMGLPFLPTYSWVGLWTGLFLVILAVTDASALMRFFTRFTNEIFSALMSLIFIYEAVRAIAKTFAASPDGAHEGALFTLILALGTFYIATQLSRMRKSKYLNHTSREFLADFGPAIAMTAMTIVALLTTSVSLPELNAPTTFGTTSGRAWLVDPTAAPVWVWGAAAAPALLAALLIALAQNITGKLINSPDNKLQNGPGYHLDLAVVGGLVAAASMFGLPWLVAATVRSLAHLRSLATVEESIGPDGQAHDHVVHVRETRVTGLLIHLMIAASLLVLGLLKSIPMAVLYGLFLYMGIVSLSGVQFIERLMLWPMDPNLYPRTHFVRRAPLRAVHRFTLVQLIALAFLSWSVAFAPGGLRLLFPLFIVMLIPLRFWLNRVFEPAHLAMLDAEATPEEESNHWTS